MPLSRGLFFCRVAASSNKVKNVLADVFSYARTKGLFNQHLPNPGNEAQLKRVPKGTVRKSMETAQYDAIYSEAPEWLQIAMIIILQTSIRQQDVWLLRWDNIMDDKLYVTVEKSRTRKRKDKRASYLKFDLKKNTPLRKAIHRARQIKMRMQGKREAFQDCPFIVFRTDIQRVNNANKTKQHPLQITRRVANTAMETARQAVIDETPLFDGWTYEELPAFHGIRKLSLQRLEDMGLSEEFLQARAAHKDFKVTKELYLTPNDPRWIDSTGKVIKW